MISIIIPCYNAEKTIKRCLESVISQTYKNIEIVIINDGSTDKTDSIIKKYINDSRIKYYNRSNHGIGKTRNFGIKETTGEYITFLDSDDYLPNDAIDNLYKLAQKNKLDLVVSDYYVDNKNIKSEKIKSFPITNVKNNPNLIFDINLAPWNKLYKKELIENIKFEENLKYEDAPFVIESIIKAKRIGKLDKETYYYVVNSNSETTIRDERIFDIFKILDIIGRLVENKKQLTEVYKTLCIRIICNYNIQQRYQKKIKTANRFINKGFYYMKKVDPKYKHSVYFKNRSKNKALIEKNKFLTKLYCFIYISLR